MKKFNKKCPICKIKFSVPFCHKHRYITCGRKCGGIYRLKPSIKNICAHCSIEFISKKSRTLKQKYCSRICSQNGKKSGKILICKKCKIEFYCPNNLLYKRNYCSNNCRLTDWNEESIKNQNPGSYRQNAWKIYEKKCYDCGIEDIRIIVIHHIDGNRKNGKINNLIPVCHNCHCLRHIELSGNNVIPSFRYQGLD